ncbi:MAG: aldehyde dehydrogenase family protein, partial [Cyclobacteriaceae bacterium]|nr:aldehyde dehydrogenase family protein [Cyclobacteriaceae bacterium]
MKISVVNPLTKEQLYEIEPLAEKELRELFDKARQIQKQIGALTVKERINEVVKISKYLIENYNGISERIVSETGKTKFEALSNEIFEVCDNIDYYRDHAEKILKDQKVHTPLILMGKKSKIKFEPMGVALIIAPWNYPLMQCFLPSILAFLAGNAVVYKPSEVTPLKGLYEEILDGAGFMKDAIQFVYGGKETGAALIEQRPDKIHFTGSTRAGKQIMAAASKHLIPVDLELGGKDPAIVFE